MYCKRSHVSAQCLGKTRAQHVNGRAQRVVTMLKFVPRTFRWLRHLSGIVYSVSRYRNGNTVSTSTADADCSRYHALSLLFASCSSGCPFQNPQLPRLGNPTFQLQDTRRVSIVLDIHALFKISDLRSVSLRQGSSNPTAFLCCISSHTTRGPSRTRQNPLLCIFVHCNVLLVREL